MLVPRSTILLPREIDHYDPESIALHALLLHDHGCQMSCWGAVATDQGFLLNEDDGIVQCLALNTLPLDALIRRCKRKTKVEAAFRMIEVDVS